jgi:hypothetical protein
MQLAEASKQNQKPSPSKFSTQHEEDPESNLTVQNIWYKGCSNLTIDLSVSLHSFVVGETQSHTLKKSIGTNPLNISQIQFWSLRA